MPQTICRQFWRLSLLGMISSDLCRIFSPRCGSCWKCNDHSIWCYASEIWDCAHTCAQFHLALNFGVGGQKEDNFEERNKPNCYGLAIWLVLLVIRLGPLNPNAVWWVSASYQPIGRVTHLSITLILQCSAQNCKSCNAKLQNLFQSPIQQTVKNAWAHDAWGHGFKSFSLYSLLPLLQHLTSAIIWVYCRS